MRLKVIACNVFMRELCLCIGRSPHVIDVEFTELGEHVKSTRLREQIQQRIDAAEAGPKEFDAICLGFGLCGNSVVGLQARRTRLVLARAHDCCTILLGSKKRFVKHFGDHPSTPFSSAGYFERGDYYLRVEDGDAKVYQGDAYAALVEQHGEDNAKFIWETMHPARPEGENRVVFIDLRETAHLGYAGQVKAKAVAEGKEYVCLKGNLKILRQLVNGEWDDDTFLIVPPGQQISGVYDWEQVMRAIPAAPAQP